jgi:hypothetical protein
MKRLPGAVERTDRHNRLGTRKQAVIARRRRRISGTNFRLRWRLSFCGLHGRGEGGVAAGRPARPVLANLALLWCRCGLRACAGAEVVVRTGAARFDFVSVLALRAAACSFSGDAGVSVFEPLNQLPIKPAIVVGFCSGAGASPCWACGAVRGIGTFAATVGWLGFAAGAVLAGVSAAAAGGVVSRGSEPGAFSTRGKAPGPTLAT